MKIENIDMILMVLGVLLLLISIASFIVLLLICIQLGKIKNKQPDRMETSVQQSVGNIGLRTLGNQTAGKQFEGNQPAVHQATGNQVPQAGLIICRNCYQAVPFGSSSCPHCSSPMDGR